MTHGHELRGGLLEGMGILGGGRQRGKIGTTIIAYIYIYAIYNSIIYIYRKEA